MADNTVFTISQGHKGLNIKSKRFNAYNKYEIAEKDLYKTMCELADIFNNVLEIGIEFEVE